MSLQVKSEIGRLRKVLVHRPGAEIDRMVPSMMEHLLFDDILYGDAARMEHDRFAEVIRRAGVEVYDSQRLLAESLASEEARADVLTVAEREYGVGPEVTSELAELAPIDLAEALVAGLRSGERAESERRPFFRLDPVPNGFFQRDPQFVCGDRVFISSMATEARRREPLLSRTIFRHHPEIGGPDAVFELDPGTALGEERHPKEIPTIEGGDVLVPREDVVLVGVSERTNRRGVEALAEHLRASRRGFRHLIVADLPARRSFMHLDTVFTFIDEGTCLAYLPVIEGGRRKSAAAYAVDLEASEIAFKPRPSLIDALAGVGIDLEIVACGGAEDLVEQEREQWTDGANAFALAPGVILLYDRNRKTVEELSKRGWRVVSEKEIVHDDAPIHGQGPTVITIRGHELSRARGGPRCMTMPLVREPLEA